MAPRPVKKAATRRTGASRKAPASGPVLGMKGRRLWSAYELLVDGVRGLVLLEEACRISDRLDKLDLLLRGDVDTWATLVHDVRTENYELKIDAALIEARQQASVLRQLMAALPLKGAAADDDADAWLDGL